MTDNHRSAYYLATGMIQRTSGIGRAPMETWARSAEHLIKTESRANLAAALAFACAEFHAVAGAREYRAPKVLDQIRERVSAYRDETVNLDSVLAMVQIESMIADYDREAERD